MADFALRRARKLLALADLPLLIHPGSVPPEWNAAAEAKGFTAIVRVRNRQHVALRCHTCGGINAVRSNVLMHHKPHCHHCLDSTRRKTAEAAGMQFRRRDPADHKYAFYAMRCDHVVRRQFEFVERMARGEVAARCETCLVAREEAEAIRFGWRRLGRDQKGNANYRLYRHACGHEQRIARANLQWGQCDCAGCGQSWTAKPSFVYLLDIRHPQTTRHYLKLGYSSHPLKRHRHQLGLPKSAEVEVLRVVAMPTGHDACMHEKAAHVRLKREHPECLVPAPEYQGFINVLSEIYKPESLPILNATLDRIEGEVTDAECIRNSGTIPMPLRTEAGIDPESAKYNPELSAHGAPPVQSPARGRTRRRAIPRDRHPVLRGHRGRTG